MGKKKARKKRKERQYLGKWGAKTIAPMAFLVAFVIVFLALPIQFGVFSITLVSIPVAMGAILYGSTKGKILGTIWGVGSFIQAAMGQDLGPIFMAINPALTFFVCVVPRAMAGWLAGVIYAAMAKLGEEKKVLAYAVTLVSTALLNSILFLGSIALMFNAAFIEWIWPVFASIVAINVVFEVVATAIVGVALAKKQLKVAETE